MNERQGAPPVPVHRHGATCSAGSSDATSSLARIEHVELASRREGGKK